jgi:hypothetical protein
MSQVAPIPVREPVEVDDRRAMTPARKHRIWLAWDRKCWFCRMPVEESGPGVIYDHVGTLWITGSDADKDIGPIHAEPCNKLKTAADLKRIAKTKRQKAKHEGTFPPARQQLRGRGFPKRWNG